MARRLGYQQASYGGVRGQGAVATALSVARWLGYQHCAYRVFLCCRSDEMEAKRSRVAPAQVSIACLTCVCVVCVCVCAHVRVREREAFTCSPRIFIQYFRLTCDIVCVCI